MEDKILESLFLDIQLWTEVVEHGVNKGIPQRFLEQVQSPKGRGDLCRRIALGEYVIEPPRTGYKAKEDGGERTFFANSPQDRLLLHAICKWLVRNEHQMIHSACLSYQEGIGIGRIVKDFSKRILALSNSDEEVIVGRKFDIHKYFETIDRKYIHEAFDRVEQHFGASCILDLLRSYYNSDVYYDTRRQCLMESYNGIKQGCAVSTWLANVLLYDMDEEVSELSGLYVRYSDDIIYIGTNYEEATAVINRHLHRIGLMLNIKKQEDITSKSFVRFLGYNIRGGEITLSQKWVKLFQKQIDRLTIKDLKLVRKVRDLRRISSPQSEKELEKISIKIQKRVARYLYYGDNQYAWATHVLGIVNRREDILQMTLYCLDAVRAMYTGKTSIGGLGVSLQYGIVRGKGKHVLSNRRITSKLENEGWLDHFISLEAMSRAISNPWLYRTLVADILLDRMDSDCLPNMEVDYPEDQKNEAKNETLLELFEDFYNSRPDGRTLDRFHARKLSEMTHMDLICGSNRQNARNRLEQFINERISFSELCPDDKKWFWQCLDHPELVLLRKWFER